MIADSHDAERRSRSTRRRATASPSTTISRVGGDGFTVLKQGTAPQFGVYDVDALFAYFQANSPIAPAAADRIRAMN